MMPTPLIIGHTTHRTRMRTLIARDRLPSTNLFAGPLGIGKSLVVRELATILLCPQQGCQACAVCSGINSSTWPDFISLDCAAKDGGTVEALRDVLLGLSLRPMGGRARVVLFDHAEHLSIQGANILLKHLEEPRPGTYFFLVTAAPSTLPVTLRSRAQTWHFDPLMPDEFLSVIEKIPETAKLPPRWTTPAMRDKLVGLSEGSPGAFVQVIEHLDVWESLEEVLDAAEAGDALPGFLKAQELHRAKELLPVTLSFLRASARRRLHQGTRTERWALFLSNILDAEYLMLERNVSPALVFHFLFLTLTAPQELAQSMGTMVSPTSLEYLAYER